LSELPGQDNVLPKNLKNLTSIYFKHKKNHVIIACAYEIWSWFVVSNCYWFS